MVSEELSSRYTREQKAVIDQYFSTLKDTRKSGKISSGVIEKEMKYWSRFHPDLVIRALEIHIGKYPERKENYTRGIMRELERQRGVENGKTGGKAKKNCSERGDYGRGKYEGHYIKGDKMPF